MESSCNRRAILSSYVKFPVLRMGFILLSHGPKRVHRISTTHSNCKALSVTTSLTYVIEHGKN